MIEETIAKLVGRIELVADTGPLLMFQRMMTNTSQQMRELGKQADALTTKLNKKLGITENNAQQTKQSRDMQAALIREQRALVATEKARKATMVADLAQRKLILADTKQEAYEVSEGLKAKQAAAIVSAKQYRAEQERLKAAGLVAKQEQSVTAAKARQATLEERLAQAKSRTAIAAQKELQSLTATQRMERSLLEARERANRAAVKFQQSQAAAQLRLQRQGERHEQGKARFIWQQDRQTAWAARQEERNNPPPESGLSTALMGLGAVGGAVASITIALDKLADRINHRQEVATDTQQFDNTLLAAGNNSIETARIKEAYISNSQEYGMQINRETAVAYSNMIQGFRAQGKTLEQAIQLQKEQAAVFRAGNLDKTQQYSAALQLNQGYGKDRFTGGDLRPLTDALGTRLTTILYKAIGKGLGYKGNPNQLSGFVLQAQHDGKVNGALVQQGMRDIVAQSGELLERHKKSLDAQAVRVENDKYLQSDALNQDPRLVAALGDRLTAERQLIQSASGLNNALKDLDIGLTKAQTAMLRMMAGKNADNTDKTPEQKAQEVGAASIIEGSAISPNDLTGKTVDYSAKTSTDPVDAFWKRLFNIPDYKDGPASKLDTTQSNLFGLPELHAKLTEFAAAIDPDTSNQWRKVDRGPVTWNMNEMMGRFDGKQAWSRAVEAAGVTNTTNTTNVTNNLNSSPVINLNGIGLDSPALADTISRQVFEDTQKMLSTANTNLAESK